MSEKKLESTNAVNICLKTILFDGNSCNIKKDINNKPPNQNFLLAYHKTFRRQKYIKPPSQNTSIDLESSITTVKCNPNSISIEPSTVNRNINEEMTTDRSTTKKIYPFFSKPLAVAPIHIKDLFHEAQLPQIDKATGNRMLGFSDGRSKSGNCIRKNIRSKPLDFYDIPSTADRESRNLPSLIKQREVEDKNIGFDVPSILKKNGKLQLDNSVDDKLLISARDKKQYKRVPTIKLDKILDISVNNDNRNFGKDNKMKISTTRRKYEDTSRRALDVKNINVSFELNPEEEELHTQRIISNQIKGFRGPEKPPPYKLISSFKRLNKWKPRNNLIVVGNQDVRTQLKSIERSMEKFQKYPEHDDDIIDYDLDYYYDDF